MLLYLYNKLFYSTPQEREYDFKEAQLIAQQNIAQTNVNEAEAKSGSLFIAGWRPAIGWIGAMALFYQFVVYPILLWLPIRSSIGLYNALHYNNCYARYCGNEIFR